MRPVTLLHELVTRRAERRPASLALVTPRGAWTYARLDQHAERAAWLFAAEGCRNCDRVGLLARKSPRAIAALLGALKAGGIAVPLDAALPTAQLARTVRACGLRVLLVGEGCEARVRALRRAGALVGVRVGWLGERDPLPRFGFDFDWSDLSAQPSAPAPVSRGRADDPALIVHAPDAPGAAVVLRHSSLLRLAQWAVRHFELAPYERLCGQQPLHSDLAAFDLFAALAAGAELHLLPPELELLPEQLAGRLRASGLTHWLAAPGLLEQFVAAGIVRDDDFPELRRVLWRGRPLPPPVLRAWRSKLPHVRFAHLYGRAEATIASCCYDLPAAPRDDREPAPLGAPCDGEELVVRDRALQPVAPGEEGELCIRGVGLSPGYWNDVERTRRAFVADPAAAPPGATLFRTGDLARLDRDGGVVLVAARADAA